MFRDNAIFAALAAVALAAATPAFAGHQLATNARVTPEEARTMTLSELAAAKFNREARRDDRFELRMAPAAPQSISSSAGFPELYRQLIASAGLTLEEASDMTLGEIAVHKFDRYETAADRQQIPSAPNRRQ